MNIICLVKKLKKIRQYELTKLDRIPLENRELIIKEYLLCYTIDRYNNKQEFLQIISELPSKMHRMAILKSRLVHLQSDDLLRLERDSSLVDTMVKNGFEELFSNAKPKKLKNEKVRRKPRPESKKGIPRVNEDLEKEKVCLKETIEEIDKKLYGLIVPKSGDFLPEFFDMIKLMTFK